jgi:hypothetical protein
MSSECSTFGRHGFVIDLLAREVILHTGRGTSRSVIVLHDKGFKLILKSTSFIEAGAF